MFFQPRHIIFPVNTHVVISLAPVGPVAIGADSYSLKISAFSGLRRYSAVREGRAFDESKFAFFEEEHALCHENGALTLPVEFPQEDRWKCELKRNGEKLEEFEVCSLEEDLFSLVPLKGDNHMHTCFSDGRESPEYRVANYARRGYDYVVVTDHGCYEGSLVAKKMVDDLHIPYLVIPGEEIHAPGNNVHIINMGGNSGVTEWYKENPDEYNSVVSARAQAIAEPMSEKDKWAAASSQEIFSQIHARGGVAILCHPHWILNGIYQESEDITNYLFDHREFDVFEMIAGGAFEEGTQMQLAYYHDVPEMPIVGSSDTHFLYGGRLEPMNYTIAFAKSRTQEDICEAVKSGICVAGCKNKLFGNYRLMRYAYFLLANYYPAHDKLATTLGDQLLCYASSGCSEKHPSFARLQEIADPLSCFENIRYQA